MADPKDKFTHENHIYLFTAVIILVALAALFFTFKSQIVGLIVYTKGILITPIWWVYSLIKMLGINYVPIISELVYSTEYLCKPSNNFLPIFCENNFRDVTLGQILKASQPWNLVFFILAIPWIKKGYDRFIDQHPAKGFMKSMDLEEFIDEQIVNHRHLQVFGPLNLSKYDTDKGHFKALDSTYEFANRHDLITGTKVRLINITIGGVTKEYDAAEEVVPIIDEEKFLSVMRDQLGDLWITIDNKSKSTYKSLEYLSNVDVLLLALYLPVACAIDEDMSDDEFKKVKSDSNKLINYYWDVCTKNIMNNPLFSEDNQYIEGDRELSGFNYEYLRKRIFEYVDHPVAKEIFKKHAYVKTILCEVIITARQLGVMPPTDIRWLKLYNRSAYAFVQNIGRPSLFCEGLGPISHYLIEIKLEKPLEEPDFNIALVGYDYQLLSFAMTKARLKAAEESNSKLKVVEYTNEDLEAGIYKSKNNKEEDFKYGDNYEFEMPKNVVIPQEEIQKGKQERY